MNVLVTGGAGFIGSALVARLAAEGHRVAVVDDGSAGDPRRPAGAAAFLEADISAAGLGAFFAAERPDAVAHLAALASVPESVRDPSRCAAVNVGGTLNVLRHSLACGARRFVLASTGGALYGDSAPRPTPEDCPARPLSPYGASKAAAEAWARAMSRSGALRCAILRLGNVYGPGRSPGGAPGVVGAFARAALRGEAPTIYGDGLDERDYVHVDDAAEAFVRVLRGRGDGAFNIGAGAARTVREVFAAVARAAGYGGGPVFAPARPGDLRRSCLDPRRAWAELGWRARVPFERGIADTVRAMDTQPPGRTARGGCIPFDPGRVRPSPAGPTVIP